MELEIITTEDGSTSMYSKKFDDNYHSKNGAMQEANHIFIKNGLELVIQNKTSVNILEIGFGTGLNALCTYAYAKKNGLKVNYIGIEPYPVQKELIFQMNYPAFFDLPEIKEVFYDMHTLPHDYPHYLSDNFIFHLLEAPFEDITLQNSVFDVVYHDPFKPSAVPLLWNTEVFGKAFHSLRVNGVLATYSSSGDVRRAMSASGFCVEKVPGPAGKREITVARKEILIAACSKQCSGCAHNHD